MAATGATVTVHTYDNDSFVIPMDVALMMNTLANLIEDLGTNDPLPLSNVTGSVFAKVVEYCTGRLVCNGADAEVAYDKQFTAELADCDPGHDTLLRVILAANYLHLSVLLEATCTKVANMMDNMTPEQIRETFNIRNDLTPEEEAQIAHEHAYWTFE